jgi:hypothetical protein
LMRGSSDVQSGIARIDVVMNRMKKVRFGILAARSGPNWTGGKTRFFVYPSPDAETIARSDSTEEGEQRTVVWSISRTRLRHLHRLPESQPTGKCPVRVVASAIVRGWCDDPLRPQVIAIGLILSWRVARDAARACQVVVLGVVHRDQVPL